MQKAVRAAGGFQRAADTVESFLHGQVINARNMVPGSNDFVEVARDDVHLTHGDTRV